MNIDYRGRLYVSNLQAAVRSTGFIDRPIDEVQYLLRIDVGFEEQHSSFS